MDNLRQTICGSRVRNRQTRQVSEIDVVAMFSRRARHIIVASISLLVRNVNGRQCCADSTVVICSGCFNTQDHSSHSVTMLVGNGSGGCCDCGDPEAFHAGAPRCGIHIASTPDADPPPIPDEVREKLPADGASQHDHYIYGVPNRAE